LGRDEPRNTLNTRKGAGFFSRERTQRTHKERRRRALELDDQPLSADTEALVGQRLMEHRQDPGTSIPVDEMKTRLRSRFG
jgi:hypothetical protein